MGAIIRWLGRFLEWIGRIGTVVSIITGWQVGVAVVAAGLTAMIAFFRQYDPLLIFIAVLTVCFLVLGILMLVSSWQTKRSLRKSAEEKSIEITGPHFVYDKRNPQKQPVQLYRIGVHNICGKPIRNCAVRMVSMKDREGRESKETGRYLWLSRQRGNVLPAGPHPKQDKKFDLSIEDHEQLMCSILTP